MPPKKISTNMLLSICKTLLNLIFPVISFPYVSRVLGVDSLGTYQFSVSVINYFIMFAGLGITTYGIREGVQFRDNPEKMSRFVSELFSINVISTIITYVFLIFMAQQSFLHDYRTVIYILSIEIAFTTLGVTWLCNVYEDFLFITVRHFAIHLVSLICTFLFVKKETDIQIYALIVAIANSSAGLINFWYIQKKYCRFRFLIGLGLLRHIRPILIIFSTTIAITVYVNSDTTMLGLLMDDREVGLYSSAVKIYSIVKNLLVSIFVVLVPQFSKFFLGDDRQGASMFLNKTMNLMFSVILPVIVGLICLSEETIIFISGVSFNEGAKALSILSIAVFFSMCASTFINCVLIPLRLEKIVFIATVISAFVNIALNLVLIPVGGKNAAAATTLIAEMIVTLISFLEAKKHVLIIINYHDITITCLGAFVVGFVCIIGKLVIDGVFARLIVLIPASMLIYGAILLRNDTTIVRELKKKGLLSKMLR